MKEHIAKITLLVVVSLSILFMYPTHAHAEDYGYYTYEVINGNEIVLTSYSGSEENVIIPNEIDEMTVTTLGTSLFFGKSGIKNITIPDSITTIGECAFEGCSGLKSIIIPNHVVTIGVDAFVGCSGLKAITIPGNVNSIGLAAFSECTELTNVTIEDGVTTIGYPHLESLRV
jgi:hypothetical protein